MVLTFLGMGGEDIRGRERQEGTFLPFGIWPSSTGALASRQMLRQSQKIDVFQISLEANQILISYGEEKTSYNTEKKKDPIFPSLPLF